MKTTVAICILVLLALGGTAEAQSILPPVACQIMVEDPNEDHGLGRRPGAGISAAITDDVTVTVLFPPAWRGDHMLTLRFLTPRGHLYQSMDVPISDTPGLHQVPGYPRPLPAKVPVPMAVNRQPFRGVQITFPIGGTSITENSLYGSWQILAFVNAADRACSQPYRMEIAP